MAWTAATAGYAPITYTVLRSTTSGSGYANVAGCEGLSTLACTDTSVSNGTTYYYVVRSTNIDGTSANSNEVSAQPIPPPSAPTLSRTITQASRIDLSWTESTGTAPITYTLRRSTTSGSGFSDVTGCVGLSTTTCNDTTVTAGTTYYYIVTATNIAGSTSSSEVSAVPMAAFSITLTPGDEQIQASFESTGATSYILEYGTDSGTYPEIVDPAISPATISSLVNGTTYYFMVTAINAAGSVQASSEASSSPTSAGEVLWTPAELGSSLALWLDADDASTITLNGSTVSQWRDKSGNSADASQATASQQPTYSSTALSGRGGITFDGVNDSLVALTNVMQDSTTHGVFWVFQRNGAGSGSDTYRPEISIFNNTGVDRGALHYIRNDNNFGACYPYYSGPTINSYDNVGPVYSSGVPQTMAFQSNTSGWGVWRNGTIEGTTSSLPVPNSSNMGYVLGAQYNPGRYSNIVMSEMLVVDPVDSATRATIEGYLAHKWGTTANLPADHPYKLSPPTTRPWTPADLGSSLALWLDADDASTITLNGSTVSQWRDKSGNGRHADQATASAQPTYNFTGLNSRPTLDFDGTNDSLKNATYQPPGAVSAFVVFRRSESKGSLLNIQRSGGIFEITGSFDATYRSITLTAGGSVNPSSGFDISGNGVDQNIILGIQHNGSTNLASNFTAHVNGVGQIVTTSGALGYLAETGFSIGGRPVQDLYQAYFNGQISEIVFLNSTTATADRQRLEGYLAHKWGTTANLPADHPFKSSPPMTIE